MQPPCNLFTIVKYNNWTLFIIRQLNHFCFLIVSTINPEISKIFFEPFKNGRIGLFDTKKGSTVSNENAKNKAEALQKYILEENKKGKNIFGGIVVPIENSNAVGLISNSENYSDNINDTSKWKPFFI